MIAEIKMVDSQRPYFNTPYALVSVGNANVKVEALTLAVTVTPPRWRCICPLVMTGREGGRMFFLLGGIALAHRNEDLRPLNPLRVFRGLVIRSASSSDRTNLPSHTGKKKLKERRRGERARTSEH